MCSTAAAAHQQQRQQNKKTEKKKCVRFKLKAIADMHRVLFSSSPRVSLSLSISLSHSSCVLPFQFHVNVNEKPKECVQHDFPVNRRVRVSQTNNKYNDNNKYIINTIFLKKKKRIERVESMRREAQCLILLKFETSKESNCPYTGYVMSSFTNLGDDKCWQLNTCYHD